MGIIKKEDVLAWEHEGKTYCVNCGDQGGEAKPLIQDDFKDLDEIIVTCDECDERIDKLFQF